MIGSLLAVLLLSAQPAPEDAPAEAAVTEAEVEVQDEAAEAEAEAAEAQAEAAAAQADAAAEAAAAEAEAAAEAAAEVETAAAEPEEEVVCRRRLRPSERIGQRHRVVTDCRPRSEWQRSRRRGGSGD